MFGARVKRIVALGSAAAALAGGAVLGVAGAASADPHHGQGDHGRQHCHIVQGQWERTWHPAYRDRHGKRHPGFWTRVWVPAHQVCNR